MLAYANLTGFHPHQLKGYTECILAMDLWDILFFFLLRDLMSTLQCSFHSEKNTRTINPGYTADKNTIKVMCTTDNWLPATRHRYMTNYIYNYRDLSYSYRNYVLPATDIWQITITITAKICTTPLTALNGSTSQAEKAKPQIQYKSPFFSDRINSVQESQDVQIGNKYLPYFTKTAVYFNNI